MSAAKVVGARRRSRSAEAGKGAGGAVRGWWFWLWAGVVGTLPGAAAAQVPQDLQPLALSLLRLEYALKERSPTAEILAGVSRAFDQATLAFFAGRNQEVLRTLDSLVAEVEPDAEARARQEETARRVLEGLPLKGRVLEGDHPPIPYRLHGPPNPSRPLPVIVALHGAGGNEHMFLEAYGAGRLREMAEEQGFVVISPATAALARTPQALDALLDAAAKEYPLDRRRVGVVGHSMGASAAWQLVQTWPGELVGVVCIAGACPGRGGPGEGATREAWPSFLVVAGETDPLAPPARLEGAVAQGRGRGLVVDYRVIAGLGHTLVVGAVLEDAVSWLLSRPTR